MSTDFILPALNETNAIPTDAFSNSTSSVHKLALRAGSHRHASHHGVFTPAILSPLVKRGAEPCAVGKPCPDKSCCGTNGKYGYGPDYCGHDNCVSNCNATAMGGNIAREDP